MPRTGKKRDLAGLRLVQHGRPLSLREPRISTAVEAKLDGALAGSGMRRHLQVETTAHPAKGVVVRLLVAAGEEPHEPAVEPHLCRPALGQRHAGRRQCRAIALQLVDEVVLQPCQSLVTVGEDIAAALEAVLGGHTVGFPHDGQLLAFTDQRLQERRITR